MLDQHLFYIEGLIFITPIKRIVFNASPLIALMGINHEDLLHQLFAEWV